MPRYSDSTPDSYAEEKFETSKQRIEQQARLASQLIESRQELLRFFPFGTELERTPYDLDRIASPVIAVVGSFSAGKSSLINAICKTELLPVQPIPTTLVPVRLRPGDKSSYLIGTDEGLQTLQSRDDAWKHIISRDSKTKYVIIQDQRLKTIPWEWLDMPGANLEAPKSSSLSLQPWDLSDLCIIATPATQPLSLSDVQQIIQLAEVFSEKYLCIAITRCDQIDNRQLASVISYVKDTMNQLLPGREVNLFQVSAKKGTGLLTLVSFIAEQACKLQEERLREQLSSYKHLIQDLEKVLKMRDLSDIRLDTIDRIQAMMDRVLVNRVSQLKANLPRVSEEFLQQLTRSLPSPQRQVATKFQQQLTSRLQNDLIELSKNVIAEAKTLAASDLTDPQPLSTLADSLSSMFRLGLPRFVDKDAAVLGGVAGAMLGLLVPGAGWALAGAALATGLAGGLLGGLLGGGKMIASLEQLREAVGRPMTIELQVQLDHALKVTRAEVRHFGSLMKKVVQIFTNPDYSKREFPEWEKLLKVAHNKAVSLENDLGSMNQVKANRSV